MEVLSRKVVNEMWIIRRFYQEMDMDDINESDRYFVDQISDIAHLFEVIMNENNDVEVVIDSIGEFDVNNFAKLVGAHYGASTIQRCFVGILEGLIKNINSELLNNINVIEYVIDDRTTLEESIHKMGTVLNLILTIITCYMGEDTETGDDTFQYFITKQQQSLIRSLFDEVIDNIEK